MPSRSQTPILIALGIGLSCLFTAVAFVLLVSVVIDVALLGGAGEYRVDGSSVSAGEFLAVGGPLLVAFIGIGASVAWGLHRRRRWLRYFVLGFWALVAAPSLLSARSGSGGAQVAVVLSLLLAFAWWYFFRKPNVVAYFTEGRGSAEAPVGPRGRPVGVTLLAIALAWLSLAGLGNAALYLAGLPLAAAGPSLAAIAAVYAVTAALAAAGLWLLMGATGVPGVVGLRARLPGRPVRVLTGGDRARKGLGRRLQRGRDRAAPCTAPLRAGRHPAAASERRRRRGPLLSLRRPSGSWRTSSREERSPAARVPRRRSGAGGRGTLRGVSRACRPDHGRGR